MGQPISEEALNSFLLSDTFRSLEELNVSKNIRLTDTILY
jgi:hypothetical protein